jgi:hypothetical protein
MGQTYSLDELGAMLGVEIDEGSRIVVPGLNTIPYAHEGWLRLPNVAGLQWYALCPDCGELIRCSERKDFESFTKVEYHEHWKEEHGKGE